VRTTGKHRRVPAKNGRRLTATASVASLALVGAALGSASNTHAILARPQTPAAHLQANFSTVAAAKAVTFTATATLPSGAPDAAEPATLQLTTVRGWETLGTKELSAAGTATFTFHPKHNHNYRVLLPAVTGNGTTILNPVMSPNIAVHIKAPSIGAQIVADAAKEKGKPYVFGAAGPNSFDCSGLVKFVFAKFGITLPHHANDMKHYGVQVSEKDAKPGDLVFVFSGSFAHHVAIYAGNGTWWEAPHTGSFVRHVKIWSSDIEFRRIV